MAGEKLDVFKLHDGLCGAGEPPPLGDTIMGKHILTYAMHLRKRRRSIILCGLVMCAIISGCTSSVTLTEQPFSEVETGTYVTSVTTIDGRTIDFTRDFPGCAFVQDSIVQWSPDSQQPQEFPVSTLRSMSVLRVSWWKTILLVMAVPAVGILIAFLTINWRLS